MDHGTLTDNNGRKADFRNVVIIMTSNAGAEALQKATIGFTICQAGRGRNGRHQAHVYPRVPQWLDAIISFKALDSEIILRVVDKFLMQLEGTAHEKKVKSPSPMHCGRGSPKGLRSVDGRRPWPPAIIQDTLPCCIGGRASCSTAWP